MKQTKYMALAIIATMFAFSSCEEDPIVTPADPTVTITAPVSFTIPVTQVNNQAVSFEFTVNAPGKIKELKIVRTRYLGANKVGDAVSTPYNVAIGGTTFTETFTNDVITGEFHLGTVDMVEFMVIVTDDNDNLADATFEVKMAAYTPFATEKTTGEIWKLHGTGKACWDLKNDAAVTAVGDAAIPDRYMINSDIVNTNDAGTASNFTGSWTSGSVAWTSTGGTNYTTTGNGTKFVKANNFDYTNAKKEKALYVFGLVVADQLTSIANPAVNDIYIAKKDAELYIIKITSFDTETVPAKLNTGVLKFSYKK